MILLIARVKGEAVFTAPAYGATALLPVYHTSDVSLFPKENSETSHIGRADAPYIIWATSFATGAPPCEGGLLLVQSNTKNKMEHAPGAETSTATEAPITYTFDNRAFVVEPVFKENAASTVSDVLLRLMRADLETS